MRNNNLSGTAAMAIVLTILAASQAKTQTEGKPVSGGSITWGVTTEPVCFDPHRANQQAAFFVARNYIDSLVGKKTDGTFAPWLATEWSISADGKEYTYKLREDVVFHDGEKFDAAAVKANYDFVKKPENTSNAAALLEAFREGRNHIALCRQIHADAAGFDVSRVNVQRQAGYHLAKVAGEGRSLRRWAACWRDGPFVFDRYTRGQSVTFVRNKAYKWGPGYAAQAVRPIWID